MNEHTPGPMDDLAEVQQVYDMLTGKLPEGVRLQHPPELPGNEAWAVIWFLQEVSRVLPDTIDRCDYCGNLYDGGETSPGYIDDTDDWFWEETTFTEQQVKSVASEHFCSWQCMWSAVTITDVEGDEQ